MMIKLRYTITFHNKAKNLERYYQNVLNSTFSIWQKGAHFVSNFLLFAIMDSTWLNLSQQFCQSINTFWAKNIFGQTKNCVKIVLVKYYLCIT